MGGLAFSKKTKKKKEKLKVQTHHRSSADAGIEINIFFLVVLVWIECDDSCWGGGKMLFFLFSGFQRWGWQRVSREKRGREGEGEGNHF